MSGRIWVSTTTYRSFHKLVQERKIAGTRDWFPVKPHSDQKISSSRVCPLSKVLFVLYIELLLKMIDNEISGVQIGQDNIKSLAYGDNVCYVVKNDQESDGVCQTIHTFCSESVASLNLVKSAFLRLNNCIIGPQSIAETIALKILGMRFSGSLNETIKSNNDNLAATIKIHVQVDFHPQFESHTESMICQHLSNHLVEDSVGKFPVGWPSLSR
jgi:hypothetical protein